MTKLEEAREAIDEAERLQQEADSLARVNVDVAISVRTLLTMAVAKLIEHEEAKEMNR